MKSSWQWLDETAMEYRSEITVESKIAPGVKFRISRCSFASRLALLEEIGQLSAQLDFARASAGAADQFTAAVLNQRIEQAYLRAGLLGVEGLLIDGAPATVDMLVAKGPEQLCREALQYIRREFELTDEERKNS